VGFTHLGGHEGLGDRHQRSRCSGLVNGRRLGAREVLQVVEIETLQWRMTSEEAECPISIEQIHEYLAGLLHPVIMKETK
jgi:hypothetical protein